MARAGQELTDARTGERVRFLATSQDTQGAHLEFESWWPPGDRPAHVHPGMEEEWEVLEGTACFVIGDRERTAAAGEVVTAAPGVVHRAWNPGPGVTHLRMRMTPALRWEDFMERLFAGASGEELVELLAEFSDEVAPPPRA